ncbi:MAG: trypsin-like peptidase domain-containing protein [Chloroflexota bacterium]|nr:trypsin-like peptidase domain-containing protein [Chloroflexota bacterium]
MANVLENLSNDLAATVETAGQSIVRIEARRRQPATGVIWSSDGLIITTHHVVERDENIRIGLPDGTTVNATLVGRDPTTDVAILRAESSGLTPATWAEKGATKVGHLVLAVGRPDANLQATLGVISAIGEAWRTGAGGTIDSFIQTDVVMYPGFSGGPLVSAGGHIIGLNTSALMRDTSVTIPAETLRRVAGALLAHGKVKRGFLGVSAQPVRLPDALAAQVGQETALILMSVESGSPADVGGLMMGDTILALDGEKVHQMDDLLALLAGDRVGKSVAVALLRGGQAHTMSVTVGERS